MATRGFWKGYLKLSLVTCPVVLTPAISDSEKIRFHTLNRATGNGVESRYVDAETGEDVDDEARVKGYERDRGEFVQLEDDELAAVGLDSTNTIDITSFVEKDSIDLLWYDRPYFLVPDDPVGEEAFSVIRDAMAATGTFGMSRLVLQRRERAVMLTPRDRGVVLWTLHFGNEVRTPGPLFDSAPTKADSEALPLLMSLIEKRTRKWDASLARDPVQENLQAIIAARGKEKPKGKPQAQGKKASSVVNIMDALKRSLAAERRS